MTLSDGTRIISYDQFPLDQFGKLTFVKRPRKCPKDRKDILDILTAFDIETTRIESIENAVMYTWQWYFHTPLNVCVVGRTWEQWHMFVTMLLDVIPGGAQLIVYDHNLSYEFQFIRAFYDFDNEEVFAVRSRKVLYCSMYNSKLCFRDSYLHSNMSLDKFLEKMGAAHQKVSGYDYQKQRYAWTELTDFEYQYICNDVIGLCEALEIEMHADGDTLHTIPLTSTGYVRRDARKALYYEAKFGCIPDMLPDWQTYCLLREAFRGGDCHANRYFAGDILHNVHSYDRSSSYPDVLCNCDFPMSKFEPVAGGADPDRIAEYMNEHIPFVCRCLFKNVRLKNKYYPAPYLPSSKCLSLKKPLLDNGRVLRADELQITITDVDFMIILDTYNWDDLYIPDISISKYRPLPKKFLTVIIDYYKIKTRLKNKADQQVYYEKAKNKLNACYGMCAQDPVKENILYDGGEWHIDNKPRAQLLEEYQQSAFLPYQWGVWCTAWARYRLYEGIKIAGPDNFVYCDTDSVKFVGNDADFTKFNRRAMRWSRESGAVGIDAKGEKHFMGVFEKEHDYYAFKTLGAKKYAYQYEENGPVLATISGVVKAAEYDDKGEPTKISGGMEIEQHGGLTAFADGFVFRDAGGLETIYNDYDYGPYMVDGHTINITSNICLAPSTYTVQITPEYQEILTQADLETLERLGLPGWQERNL